VEVMNEIALLRESIASIKHRSETIGFVPTMGALHDGHLSLVDYSSSQCDKTVVSIFVNPTQFSPNEDLAKYPRTLQQDIEKLRHHSVDVVFVPDATEIYPPGFSTMVSPPTVARCLEGEHRSEHFQGVTTVVLKLFNLVQPDIAYFGQKDYQQTIVVLQMAVDLDVNVDVRMCPIIREPSGLAMSSRNRYLDGDQRQRADALYKTLALADNLITDGQRDGRVVMAEMNQSLIDLGVDSIDYAVVADPNSLTLMDTITLPAVLLIAAHVGTTRLIDNRIVS
jgi:pantoate--beta-alanine ligase